MDNIAHEAVARTLEHWPVDQPNAYAFTTAKRLIAARTAEPALPGLEALDQVESEEPGPLQRVLDDEFFQLMNQLPPQ